MGEQFYVKRLWNVSEGSLGPRDQCRVTQGFWLESLTYSSRLVPTAAQPSLKPRITHGWGAAQPGWGGKSRSWSLEPTNVASS